MIKDVIILEYIASWINEGFTSGFHPYWKLSFDNVLHSELSDETLQHIALAVVEGYIEGEIIENGHEQNSSGWWHIQI